MTNKELAAGFRQLAQQAERYSGCFFTCNEVERQLGLDVRGLYENLFEFGPDYYDEENEPNEHRLWDDPNCQSIRVLMLSLAAAMAETGDL